MNGIDLHKTFFPNKQIDDPKWFAGRKTDIEKALKSLCSPGASIIVFGERGVGKTSFVEMVKLIAQGESHLLYKHNFQKKYPPEKLRFKIISVDCDADSTTTDKVLQRLITSPFGIRNIISSRVEKIESTVKDKVILDLLNVIKLGGQSETKVTRSEFKEENIFETFSNLILSIARNVLNPNEGLLVAIDEFDLITDGRKMASLIKNLSKSNVKFIISGISDSYEQLLEGHVSVARQFTFGRINIAPMSFNEVADLFHIVEENSNRRISFDEAFIKEVKERSGGYPYFVQLFGQLALDNFVDLNNQSSRIGINLSHLKNGIKLLGDFEYEMDRDYLSIIKENPVKELILRFMAQTTTKKIKDEEIYVKCHKHNIMPPLPKNQIASLLGHREPQFIIRENEESDYVSFKNPLFKIYANSREPELLRVRDGKYIIPS